MIELLARSETTYLERANGNLVFGNTTPLREKGTIELVIGTDRFLIPIDDNGFWHWEPATPYADGNYSISVRQFDLAGNLSAPTLATIIIDSTPPEAPELLNLFDDQGEVTGSFDAGKTTDDKRPTLTGIAQKGTTVYLLNDKNEKIGSAVADKTTGKWVIEPSQDLEEGSNSLRLVAEENFAKQLRSGAPSEAFNVVVASGSLPPDTITITDAFDNAGTFTGSLSNGALTDDATPTLNGGVTAGSTVVVYYRLAGSNVWAGSATATVTGEKWSWTPGSNLPNGHYEFQASLGAVSSALFELEIAGSSDVALRTRIDSVTDDFGAATGLLSSGAITDDATPTFRGTAEANSKVVIRYTLDGNSAATVIVDADSAGRWSWTPGASLSSGLWSFEVQAQGQSGWSDAFTLNIAAGAGGFSPVIDYAVDDAGPVTGNLSSGNTTDDTTPTLYGRAEANSVVTLRYSAPGQTAVTLTLNADSSGNWSWIAPQLANGSWTFEVQKAGQAGWSSFALNINSSADRDPTIDYAFDNEGSATGTLASGATTDDTTPTLHGTGAANSEITLRYLTSGRDIVSVTITVDSSGNWSWTAPALTNGAWYFDVLRPGQESSEAFRINVDSTADRNPTIDSAFDNVGSVTGSLSSGAFTDDTTPALRGTGAANTTLSLRYKSGSGSYTTTSVTVDASGNWTWTPSALAKGSWTFEVQKAGQSGWSSFTLNVEPTLDRNPTIDSALDNVGTVTGNLASGAFTDDTTPALRGTGAANTTLSLRYKSGSGSYTTTSVTVDGSGNWTWTPSALAKGSWTFEVQKAGQSGWSSFTLNVEPTLDRNPTIDSALDNVGSVTGSLASGAFTDDTTPALRGTGAANTTISLRYKLGSGSYTTTSITVDASGNWTWTPSALAKGSWTFEVQKAGQSGWSSFNLTVEPLVAPSTPTIIDGFDNVGPVTGSIASGGISDDRTLTLRGTGVAGEVIKIGYARQDSGYNTLGSVIVGSNGTWSYTTPQLNENGAWYFRASASNSLGESGFTKYNYIIDPNADTYPTIDSAFDNVGSVTGSLSSGATTDDATPALRGTGAANTTLSLRYKSGSGSYTTTSVTVDGSGNWTWTPSALAKGSWTFEVQKAGQSGWSSFTLNIDPVVAPSTPVITEAFDDFGPVTGSIANRGYTDDSTPTLRGTGIAGSIIYFQSSQPGVQWKDVGSVVVQADGSWSWTSPPLTQAGDWDFRAKAQNGAGESEWTDKFVLKYAASAPAAPVILDGFDDFGSVTGSIASGGITDDRTLTLRGTGVPGDVIKIGYSRYDGGYNSLSSVRVGADGNWSFRTPQLNENGAWYFRASATNGHGESGFTKYNYVIDPNADANPTITSALDNVGSVTGSLASGATTDDTTPTLRGSAPILSVISLRYRSGSGSYTTVSVTADASGNWSWTPPALAKGSWTFEVQKAGQSGWSSFNLNIDPALDRNPTIDSATDNAGSITGSLSSGAATDDTTPALRGTGAANTTISLRYKLGSGSYTTTSITVDASGNWTWTPAALQHGSWTFEVQKSGQSGWSSFSLTIEAVPAVPTLVDFFDDVGTKQGAVLPDGEKATTDDNTPTLRGRGTANSIIYIQSAKEGDNWSNLGSVRVDGSGNWSFTPDALDYAKWQFRVKAGSAVGDSAWATKVYLNIVKEAEPSIEYAFDNVGASTGNLADGATTDDNTPTLHGNFTANAVVYIRTTHSSGEKIYSVTADAADKWQWTPPASLVNGDWDFQVSKSATSGWGNVFDLTIDHKSIYEGNIDFEGNNHPITPYTVVYLNSVAVYGQNRTNKRDALAQVSTESLGEPALGNKALRLLANEGIRFDWLTHEAGNRITDFSFQLYNPSSKNITIQFSWDSSTGGSSSLYPIKVVIKPGLNTFTSEDTDILRIPKVADFRTLGIHNYENDTDTVLLDNVEWKVKPFSAFSTLSSVDESTDLHQLTAIEELIESSIIGKEHQIDTLLLTGKDQILDLTTVGNKIESIEVFDITGSGDNVLKLDLTTLLQHGEKDLFIEDGKTQLIVKGNEGDVVELKDILPEGSDVSEWKHQDGTVTVAGVEYNVYRHGDDAELLVQQGVKTELV